MLMMSEARTSGDDSLGDSDCEGKRPGENFSSFFRESNSGREFRHCKAFFFFSFIYMEIKVGCGVFDNSNSMAVVERGGILP